MEMLSVLKVKKHFGSKKVIDDLSFSIPKNSIFGFVGQNGAGKTTTMKMILGLMKMDAGEIRVDGEKVQYGDTPTNRKIGYLPDVPEFYSFMTPKEYLAFCGEIAGMPKKETALRAEELLERVGLKKEHRRIKGFSRGMKQRLGIAQALMGRPKLLICDEPTSALDPVGRKEILDILTAAREETTIMFSTHILSDVERICDRIAFLHEGKIAFSGTMEEVKKQRRREDIFVVLSREADALRVQEHFPDSERKEAAALLIHGQQKDAFREVMEYLLNQSIAVEKIEKCEITLENLFMEVVGK